MTLLPTNTEARSLGDAAPKGMFERLLPSLALLLALIPIALILFRERSLPAYWQSMGVYWLLLWTASTACLALLLKWRWPRQASQFLLGTVGLFFVLVIGLLPLVCTLLLLVASLLTGQRLLRWLLRNGTPTTSMMPGFYCGLAIYLCVFGIMLHFKVNFPLFYFVLLLLPVLPALRPHDYAGSRLLGQCTQGWQELHQSLPYPLLVLLVMGVGFISSYTFLPTMQFDDLHLHLRLWTELSWQRKAAFDFATDVWALAPFATDLQHAVTSVLAGQDSRSALALIWTLLLITEFWRIGASMQAKPWLRSLALLLFVSTPIFANQLLTLQTELFTALLVTSGCRLVLDAEKSTLPHYLAGLLALIAIAVAVKLTGAVLGFCLLVTALLAWHQHKPWQTLGQQPWRWLGLLALLAFVAFHAYAYAWYRTGNPVFPLYNKLFQSPFFAIDANMADDRWISGFNLKSYWDVFFSTSRHHEGRDYTAGFQYLLLLPLAVIAAVRRADRWRWALVIIPLVGFGLVMFGNLQYWRYLFPVLPLASLLLMSLWPVGGPTSPSFQRPLLCAAFAVTIALNLYFLPGILWIFENSPMLALTNNARQRMVEQTVPELTINSRLNNSTANPRVLYAGGSSYGATLKGQPLYMEWLSPVMQAKAAAVSGYESIAPFMDENRVDFVVFNQKMVEPVGLPRWQLGHYLSRFGFPEFNVASQVAYRINQSEIPYLPLFSLETWAATNNQRLPLTATIEPITLSSIGLLRARAVRYHAQYECNDQSGYFVAQLNWDNGMSYYRLVSCDRSVDFQESIPVPAGVNSAQLYVTARDRSTVTVNALTLEKF